ncbi:hypothetical protein U2A4042350011 [Corynebacterium striatum]|nr:hypothetical protein U2A4042350011 [Corynebacterium striatum]
MLTLDESRVPHDRWLLTLRLTQ